jgi:hypothetical protein
MKSQLLNEELNRIKKIMFKPELLEESLAQLAKGTLDNIIKVAVDDALTKILKSYTDDVLSKMIKLGSATDEVTKRLTSSTEFNKLTKDIEKNIGQKLGKSNYTLSGLDKVTLRAQLTDSIQKTADKVIRQKKVGIDALGNTAQKGGKEAGEKFVSTIGKEGGEKVVSTTGKEAGDKVISTINKETGERVLMKLPEPKPGQWSAGMESAYKEGANELRRRNPQILNQTIEASKNLKNPKNKRMFLDGLEKLGILTIKDGKRKISKTSLFLGIGGGILLSSWLLGGGATEEGIEVETPDAIKDDAKKFEEKIQKERNWRLQDPEFGQRLKKVLDKSPEEQFTDQDIDDIYKKLTDLKVIQ